MATNVASSGKGGTGLILGKFMPPHLGHHYLIDFGRHYVRDLTVLVCTRACEPLAGSLRFSWMHEMFSHSGIRLVHVTDDVPQTPQEHPDFWTIWRDLIRRYVPAGPDYIFACESYGFPLAQTLGARYIPVDRARELVPVSATACRHDPLGNWQYLPACVRAHYVKRICLFGPESTGKTTLAARLARHFNTVWVGEHARPLLDHKAGVCEAEDIPLIARGQVAAEAALARQANRVLLCDTDPLLTCVWSEVLFGSCSQSLKELARAQHYDLYFLMNIDVPWVNDGQRYLAHARQDFLARCQAILEAEQRSYVTLSGSWDARFEQAVAHIQQLIDKLPT